MISWRVLPTRQALTVSYEHVSRAVIHTRRVVLVANEDSLVTGLTCADAPASAWPESRALGSVAAQLRAGALQSRGGGITRRARGT
jgi:hypothetical protein